MDELFNGQRKELASLKSHLPGCSPGFFKKLIGKRDGSFHGSRLYHGNTIVNNQRQSLT